MPKETTNYDFKKPLYSDNADIAVLNENFDTIDEILTPTISALAAPGNATKGKLGVVLGWLANRIKAITGLNSWQGTPSVTLEDCKEHIDNGTHQSATVSRSGFMSASDKSILSSATSESAINTLIRRDDNGRAKVSTPSDSYDIANKTYVDTNFARKNSDTTMSAKLIAQSNTAYTTKQVRNIVIKKATDIFVNVNDEFVSLPPVYSAYLKTQSDSMTLYTFAPSTSSKYHIKNNRISGDHEIRLYSSDFIPLYDGYFYDKTFDLVEGQVYYITQTHYYNAEESESYLQIYKED